MPAWADITIRTAIIIAITAITGTDAVSRRAPSDPHCPAALQGDPDRSVCHCFPNGDGPVPFSVNSNLAADRLGFAPERRGRPLLPTDRPTNLRRNRPQGLGRLATFAAGVLLSIALAGCAGGEDSRSITFTDDRGVSSQPFPKNYRAETLAFMRTYLNNPTGVRDAVMADPVQRTVGGRIRYVGCLRFTPRESDGGYREQRERPLLFVDGRLDRMIENA